MTSAAIENIKAERPKKKKNERVLQQKALHPETTSVCPPPHPFTPLLNVFDTPLAQQFEVFYDLAEMEHVIFLMVHPLTFLLLLAI